MTMWVGQVSVLIVLKGHHVGCEFEIVEIVETVELKRQGIVLNPSNMSYLAAILTFILIKETKKKKMPTPWM